MDFFSHLLFGFIIGQALQLDGNFQVILVVSSVILDIDAISVPSWQTSFVFHRGPLHSIPSTVLFSLLIGTISSLLLHLPVTISIAIMPICFGGLLLHMFFDLLTSGGIRVLWPFSNRKFSFDLTYFIDPVIFAVLLVTSILIAFMNYSINAVGIVTILALILLTVNFGIRYDRRNIAAETVKQLDSSANRRVLVMPTIRPDRWTVVAKTPLDDGYRYEMYRVDSMRESILSRITVESPYLEYRGSFELPINSPGKAVGYSRKNHQVNALVERLYLPAVHVTPSDDGEEWRVFWYDAFVQTSGVKSRGIDVRIGFDGTLRFGTANGFWR